VLKTIIIHGLYYLYKQKRQCTYDVTVRSVRATIVVVEKQ